MTSLSLLAGRTVDSYVAIFEYALLCVAGISYSQCQSVRVTYSGHTHPNKEIGMIYL